MKLVDLRMGDVLVFECGAWGFIVTQFGGHTMVLIDKYSVVATALLWGWYLDCPPSSSYEIKAILRLKNIGDFGSTNLLCYESI